MTAEVLSDVTVQPLEVGKRQLTAYRSGSTLPTFGSSQSSLTSWPVSSTTRFMGGPMKGCSVVVVGTTVVVVGAAVVVVVVVGDQPSSEKVTAIDPVGTSIPADSRWYVVNRNT
jgi:hypothetical protein